jgi:hypothetical protein
VEAQQRQGGSTHPRRIHHIRIHLSDDALSCVTTTCTSP